MMSHFSDVMVSSEAPRHSLDPPTQGLPVQRVFVGQCGGQGLPVQRVIVGQWGGQQVGHKFQTDDIQT